MKKNQYTAIEITDSHVKLLQVKQIRGKSVISNCLVKSLNSPPTDEELTRILTDVVLSKSVQSDSLVLAIPRQFAILKHIELPSTNDQEIKKMIGLQLVNKVPYGLEDIVYDYQVIRKDESGFSNVLAYVVHKEIISRYMKMFTKIGVNIERVTISSLGLAGWLTYQLSVKKADTNQTIVLISIDMNHSEICFYQNGNLVFSRNIDEGARDLNEEHILGLFQQIEVSVGIYRKENMGSDIQKMVIVSSMSEAMELRPKLEEEYKIPIEVMSPFDNVMCQKKINLSSLKNQGGLSLSAAIGLLLTDSKNTLNLLPKEVFTTKQSKIRRKELIKFSVLFVIASLLGISILGIEIYQKSSEIGALQEKADQIKVLVKKAKKDLDFMGAFKDQIIDKVIISDLIRELAGLAPKEVSFRALSLDEKKRFTIEGYAQTSSSVNEFQSNLVKSEYFNEVNLQFATKRKIIKMEVTDFKIVCQLAKKGEE